MDDREAISIVYDKYASAVYGVILRMLKSPEKAESVLEQTFLKIFKDIHTYQGHLSLLGQIMIIARQTARESQLQDTERHLTTSKLEPLMGISMLESMDSECREVIVRLCYRSHTLHETALALNLPIERVTEQLRCGLSKLNGHFNKKVKL